VNISESGIRVITFTKLYRGTDVALRFTLPGTPSVQDVRCEVCWFDSSGRAAGLRFLSQSAAQRTELEAWLTQRLENILRNGFLLNFAVPYLNKAEDAFLNLQQQFDLHKCEGGQLGWCQKLERTSKQSFHCPEDAQVLTRVFGQENGRRSAGLAVPRRPRGKTDSATRALASREDFQSVDEPDDALAEEIDRARPDPSRTSEPSAWTELTTMLLPQTWAFCATLARVLYSVAVLFAGELARSNILSLPPKSDGLWLRFNRNLHFGTRIQLDLLAVLVSQGILNADHLVVVIRSFDRNLCCFWFARNMGFNNGFDRSGQGGARYLFHDFSFWRANLSYAGFKTASEQFSSRPPWACQRQTSGVLWRPHGSPFPPAGPYGIGTPLSTLCVSRVFRGHSIVQL
jgi:PilZ domain